MTNSTSYDQKGIFLSVISPGKVRTHAHRSNDRILAEVLSSGLADERCGQNIIQGFVWIEEGAKAKADDISSWMYQTSTFNEIKSSKLSVYQFLDVADVNFQ